jgi:ABC-type multidrug transport system ATPase subunit
MRRVELQSVSRIFGRTFALHRVSCSFEAGTCTALLGANGAGKTTMLNLLATLDRPTRGEILYDEARWSRFARSGRAAIGWVSHDSLLYDDLSGRENLTFYGRMYGIDDRAGRVDAWLERVGLVEAADRRVQTYSRGMRQRLTLARALLHDPSLLLLDEPMTGLDQRGRAEMIELLGSLRARQKLLVLVTHDLESLGSFVDRIAVLRRGRLAHLSEVTDPSEITEAYRTHA